MLLSKLEPYDIKEYSLKWFESYLSFSEQKRRMNGTLRNFVKSLGGVPQSSILGPLLFLIYQ